MKYLIVTLGILISTSALSAQQMQPQSQETIEQSLIKQYGAANAELVYKAAQLQEQVKKLTEQVEILRKKEQPLTPNPDAPVKSEEPKK